MTTTHPILKHSDYCKIEPFTDMQAWKCGTCRGFWVVEPDRLLVSAVRNDSPHNGHFAAFMRQVERFAASQKKDLLFISFMNPRFKEHLIRCRGYEETEVIVRKDGEHTDGVIKRFGGEA